MHGGARSIKDHSEGFMSTRAERLSISKRSKIKQSIDPQGPLLKPLVINVGTDINDCGLLVPSNVDTTRNSTNGALERQMSSPNLGAGFP